MPCSSETFEFSSFQLSAGKIDQSYPLIRELREDLTLEGWREYARSYCSPQPVDEGHRGIVVTEYRQIIRGLLNYDILADLADRKTLNVRDVIVPRLPAGEPAARTLLQELFAIAEAHRCDSIRIDLTKDMEWLFREWFDPAGRLYRFPVFCFLIGLQGQTPRVTVQRQEQPRLRSVKLNE